MEIKGTSFLEGHLNLDGGQGRRNTTARDGLDKSCPDIRTEERRRNVGIADIKQRSGEGLEVIGLLGGEVDNLCPYSLSVTSPAGT